jgi:outer membrane protein OmpA-like peptidoglycan-associated protein
MKPRSVVLCVAIAGATACHQSSTAVPDAQRAGGGAAQHSRGAPAGAPSSNQSGATQNSRSAHAPADTPIDVNASIGAPPMDVEEAALAHKVLDVLAADQRITSKRIYVGVTHSFNGTRRNDPVVMVAGSVASEEESTAAYNDVIKMQGSGWIVSKSLTIDRARSSQAAQAMDAPGPWTESSASAGPNIPLCSGLSIVTAVASAGDYESIKTIESVDERGVRLKYSSESNQPWWSVLPALRNCEIGTPGCTATQMITHRFVLAADLESAHKYDQIFVTDKIASDTNPGTTAIGTSAAVLRDLKTKGASEISLCVFAADGQGVEEHNIDGSRQLRPTPGGCESFSPIPIRRVGNSPVPVRVLLDGVPVDLPAVQAQGEHGPYSFSDRDEFFFLDDERNPLTLKFRLAIGAVPALDPQTTRLCETARTQGTLSLGGNPPMNCDLPYGGDRDVLRVVKIETRCEAPRAQTATGPEPLAGAAGALEKALAETGKIDIYSIYFSFNSDKLRDESRPTLEDIAEVMRRHPDWNLQVNGHTDGIGGDAFNLDLSKRRSSSVKSALVGQFKIDGNRLVTSGFGKSQPKDTNDTLEGRARNRRVELMRVSR